jgi:hypothetical protein
MVKPIKTLRKMKINLIRDRNVDQEVYAQVVDLLQSTPGAIQFKGEFIVEEEEEPEVQFSISFKNKIISEKSADIESSEKEQHLPQASMAYKPRFSWRKLFERSNIVRQTESIPEIEASYLITDKENELNYFSAFDVNQPTNGFIQASDWDLFIDSPAAYPIAYQVIATFLQSHMFKSMEEVQQYTHHKPIGCLNDYCQDKSQVLLKLRTADICKNCMSILKDRVEPSLLKHAIDLMESLRLKMKFVQNIDDEQTRLKITNKQLQFIGNFGTITISLAPMEMAIYKLFLNHKEGIRFADLVDYKDEFLNYYRALSPNLTYDACLSTITKYIRTFEDNSMSERISKIRKKIEGGLGKEQAKSFIISGVNAEPKRIEVDRGFVNY